MITERFIRSAEVVGEVNGLPGYPFVVIGHPVANDDDEALRRKAEGAIKAIVSMLTERQDTGRGV